MMIVRCRAGWKSDQAGRRRNEVRQTLVCRSLVYSASDKLKFVGPFMRAVVQRVTRASVTVDDEVIGEIGNGLVVLIGIARDDTKVEAAYLVDKITSLRIFDDEEGKMNL